MGIAQGVGSVRYRLLEKHRAAGGVSVVVTPHAIDVAKDRVICINGIGPWRTLERPVQNEVHPIEVYYSIDLIGILNAFGPDEQLISTDGPYGAVNDRDARAYGSSQIRRSGIVVGDFYITTAGSGE